MADLAHELFVISDLHIGGAPGVGGERGFCINTHVPLLTQFVHRVIAYRRQAAARVELVVNGDFVDFLAQEVPSGGPWSAFIADAAEAVQAFQAIRSRAAGFFDALREWVAQGGDLTILLGNHDLELSLPAVREALLAGLCVPAAGRVQFIFDGEAHVVGDVLIEHGNRYDGFNVVDHDRLRRLRSAMSRRLPIRPEDGFEPPTGSRLVEQVMNPLKKAYAFIDLLKPENEAVIPLLVALEPGLLADIERLWRLARLKREATRNTSGTPGQPVGAGQIGTAMQAQPAASALREMLGASLPADELDELEALATTAATAAPIGILDDARQALSLWRQSVGGAAWRLRMKVLLAALRRLQHDQSFNPAFETEALMQHVRCLGKAGFRVVVFGHTHLPKRVVADDGMVYLNTGTWADVMRVPEALFARDEALAHQALDGFVDDLRQRRYDGHMVFAPSFAHVSIDAAGQARSAHLHRFDAAREDFP